jgi:biopolymer transport protein ExbD
VSIPDADSKGSLIVSVTANGNVYLGTNPINPAALAETIKAALSNQTGKKLYIKADAHTPYSNVMKVLDAVRTAGVEPALLTAQRDSSEAGTVMPPKGFDVLLGPPSVSDSIVLQLLNSGQRTPTLKINNEQIPWANLQRTLEQLLRNRSEKVVQVKANGRLPFADVVEVTDSCSSAGAKVVLVTPGL